MHHTRKFYENKILGKLIDLLGLDDGYSMIEPDIYLTFGQKWINSI